MTSAISAVVFCVYLLNFFLIISKNIIEYLSVSITHYLTIDFVCLN